MKFQHLTSPMIKGTEIERIQAGFFSKQKPRSMRAKETQIQPKKSSSRRPKSETFAGQIEEDVLQPVETERGEEISWFLTSSSSLSLAKGKE